MGWNSLCFCLCFLFSHAGTVSAGEPVNTAYAPNWESLDKHPLPKWFDEAKLGLFIHWGPFSSVKSQPIRHEYEDPSDLTAEKFNADEWVRIARECGFRYITFTAKHGGGYAMFNTKFGKWNSVASGPRRDFVKELSEACARDKMRLIVYYCKDDMFLPETAPLLAPFKISDKSRYEEILSEYEMRSVKADWVNYFQGQIRELASNYAIDGFWLDGVRLPSEYVRTKNLLADLYNSHPDLLVNDRVGTALERKKHGDFLTYERAFLKPVHILPKKWERCEKLDNEWWYAGEGGLRDIEPSELLWEIVDVISLGGNYAVGIGPRPDGTIPEKDVKCLMQLGQWLRTNKEAFYDSIPWAWGYCRQGENVRFTLSRHDNVVYAFLRGWPDKAVVIDRFNDGIGTVNSVELLATGEKLEWDRKKFEVKLPKRPEGLGVYVLKFNIER
jgi:alpha-L-fucosidase